MFVAFSGAARAREKEKEEDEVVESLTTNDQPALTFCLVNDHVNLLNICKVEFSDKQRTQLGPQTPYIKSP